jgi:ATP-dependent Zn protease
VNRLLRSALFPLIVIVLLVYLAGETLLGDDPPTRQMSYAQAQQLLRDNPERVDEVTLRPNEREAVVKLADGTKAKTSGSSTWWPILTALLPFVLLFGFWIHLQNRSRRRAEEDLTAQVRNRSTA